MEPVRVGQIVLSACLVEATARKPGNVYPGVRFEGTCYHDFVASAQAIAPVFAAPRQQRVGQMISRAVDVTLEAVGQNTNLGIILLTAPLVAADPPFSAAGLPELLRNLSIDDARQVYAAIDRAQPGGLGVATEHDVREVPAISLYEAMALAASRDLVAQQYVTDFVDVFRLADQFSARCFADLERQILTAYLRQLSSQPDTLIARKCGIATSLEASRQAAELLANIEGQLTCSSLSVQQFDDWLRADGNRRNPGSTADLIAAALMVSMARNAIPRFSTREIQQAVCGFGNA